MKLIITTSSWILRYVYASFWMFYRHFNTNSSPANVPETFNDKISSMGGSYTGVCYGYRDGGCTGE